MMRHLLVTVLCVLATVSASQAQTWDLFTDWTEDPSANTNTSIWSYRWEDDHDDPTMRDGNYNLMTRDSFFDEVWDVGLTPQFWVKAADDPPFAWRNNTGEDVGITGQALIPTGSLMTNPTTGRMAIYSWLSPITGFVEIAWQSTNVQASGGTRYFVEKNNSSNTLVDVSLPGGSVGDTTGLRTIFGVPITIGDRINLVIDADGSGNSDSQSIKFTITPGTAIGTRSWNIDSSGDWKMAENWHPDGIPNDVFHTARFGPVIHSPRIVFTETDVTVRAVEFESVNTYAVTGIGTVNVSAGTSPFSSSLAVLVGNHQFQAPVRLHNDTNVHVSLGASLAFINSLDLNGRTLTMSGGGELGIRSDLITGGGMLNIQQGTLLGNGTVGGDVDNSGGTIKPGNPSASFFALPEPSALLTFVGGLLGIAFFLRRRR